MHVIADQQLCTLGFGCVVCKTDELARRLDELFQELRDSRAALVTKIDDSMHDLAIKLHACEQQLTSHHDRLAAIERAQVTMETDIAALKASPAAGTQSTTAVTVTPNVPPPLAMDSVVRELNLRASKKRISLSQVSDLLCLLITIWLSVSCTMN